MFNELLKDKDLGFTSVDQVRLRNPKNDDMGEVLFNDEATLETLFVFDNKEFIVQKMPESAIDTGEHYNVLVREWCPADWSFGPLHEVAIDKLMSTDKLA